MRQEPRPVYIVPAPAPARRNWFGAAVIVALAVLVIGGALQQRQAAQTPVATPGLPAPTAAATPDQRLLAVAVQTALDRQQERLNAKQAECDSLDGAAYDKCDAAWSKLDGQWDALSACLDGVAVVGDVAACERKAGIH